MTYLIHVYGLQCLSPSENYGVVLVFGFSFTDLCWRTWKLDSVYFLKSGKGVYVSEFSEG